MKTSQSLDSRERVLLVGVSLKKHARGQGPEPPVAARDSLAELEELAYSAGAAIGGTILQVRDSLDPATLVGRGKLEEIRAEAQARHVPLVIVDHDLTPVQLRNMEKGTGCRVIDRTQLILDIFATHARTREGQLQVELAQLNYLLPRLTGRGEELSRLGGGIGTRGPGEQKLETDRRRIRDRVRKIQQSIETVRRQRTTRRRARQAVPLGMIALVGYTNAGKSTLFNALTHAAVLTSSKMFATLDPTIRALRLPSRRRVLAVRHGGIRARSASGLDRRVSRHSRRGTGSRAHSSGHRYFQSPSRGTRRRSAEGLRDLGVEDRPRLHVFNKIDRLTKEDLAILTKSIAATSRLCLPRRSPGQASTTCSRRIDKPMPVDPLMRAPLPSARFRRPTPFAAARRRAAFSILPYPTGISCSTRKCPNPWRENSRHSFCETALRGRGKSGHRSLNPVEILVEKDSRL